MIWLVLIVVGLAMGSFVNALVWRWHEGKNWLNDRSECVHCHHKLGVADLVPVLSWLWLRGKCRYCGKKIEDSPIVEIFTALVFIVSYAYWPNPLQGSEIVVFGLWLAISVVLIALLAYDLRWFLLPDKMVAFAGALALAQAIIVLAAVPGGGFGHVLANMIGGVLVGGGVFYLLFLVSGGKWIGGGDVKLGFVLGLLAGSPGKGLLLLFTASVLGTLYALPFLIGSKLKKDSHIPFGPFLVLAAIVVVLFGASLIAWYQQHFLPVTAA